MNARVAIDGKTCALLVAGHDGLQVALQKLTVETEDVIARDTEDMVLVVRLEPLDEILADAEAAIHRQKLAQSGAGSQVAQFLWRSAGRLG